MIMLSISPIPAFSDNYIWCVAHDGEAIIVDPGDAAPVLKYLEEHQLKLSAILITHHHYDHVNGIELLSEHYPQAPVYGPNNECPGITQRMSHGQALTLFGHRIEVIAVPGHTLDHIAYYISDCAPSPLLFCGDTLFAGGCGRLFEGTAEQMLESLGLISALPTNTAVYCAHEYTLSNLRFAQTVEPSNQDLEHRIADASRRRAEGLPTVPSKLALELLTNPFLRTGKSAVQASVNAHTEGKCRDEKDIFANLRKWKDDF
ncbi:MULTISPECIES: hydroxyacylglutathione hydrolase [Zhongshania]|jgi:hydroxyacylglutathione hydrolase|uniref:Hydroxyacylglutathione hydrolase n=2 Tax=Zhongshania antarctica TaxID=641702 RepID=A0A840R4T4_9GAMM|nr:MULTISPECIES: hydroxyacylglutathione hydrolase [Zhongshania]MBB5187574.1 hydroxyacylglutathione hydrolase [Zhongshania antarctica]